MPTDRKKFDVPALLLGGCLVYIMLRPVGASTILYSLLGLMGITGVWINFSRRQHINRYLKNSAVLAFVVAALGIGVGASNPGLINGLLTWVIAPAVFWVWAVALQGRVLRTTLYAAALGTILLSGMILLYVGAESGSLPNILPPALLEEVGAGFDGTGESTAIRLYGLSTLAAAAPMWVASLMAGKHHMLPSYLIRTVAAVTASSAALLGGRRAIVVVICLTPIIVWLMKMLVHQGQSIRIPALSVIAAPFVLALALVAAPKISESPALQAAWIAVRDLFNPSANSLDGAVRREQIGELVNGLAQSPVFGHGFGATLESGYSRSSDRPWNFEMQYHLIGFQVGLLGLALLAVAALFVFVGARVGAKNDPEMRPVLIVTGAAGISMAIANATNPYLQAPGHMWAIFIFIGAVNAALMARTEIAERTGNEERKIRQR